MGVSQTYQKPVQSSKIHNNNNNNNGYSSQTSTELIGVSVGVGVGVDALIWSHVLGGSSVDKGSRRSVFTQFPVYKSNPCLSALVDSRWSFNKFTPATVLVTATKTTQTTIKSNNITINNNNKINTNNSRSRSNGKERKTPTAQSCQQTMQQLANEKQHSQFPVHIHIVATTLHRVTQLE